MNKASLKSDLNIFVPFSKYFIFKVTLVQSKCHLLIGSCGQIR